MRRKTRRSRTDGAVVRQAHHERGLSSIPFVLSLSKDIISLEQARSKLLKRRIHPLPKVFGPEPQQSLRRYSHEVGAQLDELGDPGGDWGVS